jgi:8-oxo-dGTP diphosphatase
MFDPAYIADVLAKHVYVGAAKPVSYLPISTIEKVLNMQVDAYARLIEKAGGKCVVFSETETCIRSGAVYAYSEIDLASVLKNYKGVLSEHGWPSVPLEFIKRLATDWLDLHNPLRGVLISAFGDHPISVKGVLIHDSCVLLLLNERGEWDLPGGRPDPGEDHRTALKREVQEEAGLDVEIGAALDGHLFEVLPGRFVRIEAFVCAMTGACDVTLSHEHRDVRWVPLPELGEIVAGHRLPKGYLGAIRQAIDQPRSPSERVV